MKASNTLVIIAVLVGLLAAVQAGAGLFWQSEGQPFEFTTLRGETVEMYGRDVYRYDTSFKVPIHHATDAVTLFLVLPLLAVSIAKYRSGSLSGGIALTSILSYLFYNSASYAFGTAYNDLILVYIAYFSATSFALFLAITKIDTAAVARLLKPRIPHRATAAVIFIAGLAVMVAWLIDIVAALLTGTVPPIDSYTTDFTYVFDLAIIAPLSFLTVYLLSRRAPAGYLIAVILLTNLSLIGVLVIAQSVFQFQAGFDLPVEVLIGKAGSFAVLSLFAVWLVSLFLRSLSATERPA